MEGKVNNIYEAIKENMLNMGVDQSQIDSYMRETKFTISFGETEIWENRNHNPKLVKKDAMTISYKEK